MHLLQTLLARHASRGMLVERTVVAMELEHLPDADILVAEDCRFIQNTPKHRAVSRWYLHTTPLSAMSRALDCPYQTLYPN